MFLCSSSSHSVPENVETSSKGYHNSIKTEKNRTEEELFIHLALKSGDKDRIFGAIKYLADKTAHEPIVNRFTICEINVILMKRYIRPSPVYMPFRNSVSILDRFMKFEMKWGLSSLYGFLLYGIALERPEMIDLISVILDLNPWVIQQVDWRRRNILHRLAHKDFSSRPYLQVAELLIERGIKMDVGNANGETPMEIAIVHENLEMLRLLLRNGGTRVYNHYLNIAHFALVNDRRSCLHAIIKFYLVRKFQGKVVDDNIMNFITSEQLSEHYNLCLKDLESLKNNIIVNTNVSLYDILFKPKKYLVKYLRNKDVLSGISKIIMEKSEFSYDLEEIQDTVLIRRDLEDSTLIMFKKHFKLPEFCLEKIISHLDNDSLRNVTALETSSKPRRYYKDFH
ncbi:uncharacterized protein LOC123671666 isoform X1 [Harmonia axyridis]|uniref:uncharacterized protein LOC123671666 isoform X1 n=1 Tax=Harmonia axyridis TaxID=115357 RepID=UPI001E279275|nr:uncharacterized protein LOC123671666 isoform X1 [Harmonia axyridis]